jgi:hypothetical protein
MLLLFPYIFGTASFRYDLTDEQGEEGVWTLEGRLHWLADQEEGTLVRN